MTRILVDPDALDLLAFQTASIAEAHRELNQGLVKSLSRANVLPSVSVLSATLSSSGDSIYDELTALGQLLKDKAQAFRSADLFPINFHTMGSTELGGSYVYACFASDERAKSNNVEASHPLFGAPIETDPSSSLGISPKDWQEKPLNAVSSLGGNMIAANQFYVAYNRYRDGFGVQKSFRVTAQGKRKVVLKVSEGHLDGIRKKTYSGANATNYKKLYKYVDPKTAVKEGFKWKDGKLGYAGLAITAVGNIANGIKSKDSKSKITGEVVGDTAVGLASMAGSAWAGAQAGAVAGTFVGGPVGTVIGAGVGFVSSVAINWALSDFKFMDVDHDGKADSVGDAIKKGTTGLINKVGSWFD